MEERVAIVIYMTISFDCILNNVYSATGNVTFSFDCMLSYVYSDTEDVTLSFDCVLTWILRVLYTKKIIAVSKILQASLNNVYSDTGNSMKLLQIQWYLLCGYLFD